MERPLNPGGPPLGWNSEPGDGACHRTTGFFFSIGQDKRESGGGRGYVDPCLGDWQVEGAMCQWSRKKRMLEGGGYLNGRRK